MAISEKDIKLLWGRAAERCSFPDCRRKLTQDKKSASGSYPLGIQAHIIGAKETAARGESLLTEDERNSYFNLILLCPTHHDLVDKNPEDYPVDKLHIMKAQHELWVGETLSESKDVQKTAQDIIYADLIDAAAEACQFESWDKWASRAASTNKNWDEDAQDRIFKFLNKIIGAVWPNTLPELECALKKLADEIHSAIATFVEHCKPGRGRDDLMVEDRFYHIPEWDPPLYKRLSEEYDVWCGKCEKHVIEATKAANWLADVVRRDINPLFFATKGKFFVIMGPYDCLEFRSYFFEYTDKEKKDLLRFCSQHKMWPAKDFRKLESK